jgi:hypothetical protein
MAVFMHVHNVSLLILKHSMTTPASAALQGETHDFAIGNAASLFINPIRLLAHHSLNATAKLCGAFAPVTFVGIAWDDYWFPFVTLRYTLFLPSL